MINLIKKEVVTILYIIYMKVLLLMMVHGNVIQNYTIIYNRKNVVIKLFEVKVERGDSKCIGIKCRGSNDP